MLTVTRQDGDVVYIDGPDGKPLGKIVTHTLRSSSCKLSIDLPSEYRIRRDDMKEERPCGKGDSTANMETCDLQSLRMAGP